MKYLPYLLGSVLIVLLYLFAREFEDLHPIGVSCLCGLGLLEKVDYFLVGVGLFDVAVVEVNDGVAVWEGLTPNFVRKNDLLFIVKINSLNLAISSFYFVFDSCVLGVSVIMI